MTSKQHHFVLAHGAGHGAWCWARVVPGLEKAGHRVTTIDFMGAGDSPLDANDCTSFEQYNQPLEDLFKSFPDGEKVILVGHSMGGLSLTYMSEHFPKNISVAVYLAAFMPPPGLHLFDMLMNTPGFMAPLSVQFTYKVDGAPPTAQKLCDADVKEYLYNECTLEDLATGIKRYRTCPMIDVMFAPIHGTKENYGSVPKVCVIALQDKLLFPASIRKLIEINPLHPPDEVIEINADHCLFFSAHDAVVKILNDTAAKYDTRE